MLTVGPAATDGATLAGVTVAGAGVAAGVVGTGVAADPLVHAATSAATRNVVGSNRRRMTLLYHGCDRRCDRHSLLSAALIRNWLRSQSPSDLGPNALSRRL